MSALSACRRFRFTALWCRPPPAGRARNLRRIPEQLQHCITYSNSQEGGGGRPAAPTVTTSALGIKRRRSLSPLDRLRGLIPPECISQELRDLQGSELSLSQQDHPSPSPSQQDHPIPSSFQQDQLSSSPSHQDHPCPSLSRQDHLSSSLSRQDHLSSPSSQQESAAPGSPEPLPSPSLQENNVPPDLRSPPESPPPWQVAPLQPGDLLIAEYNKRYYNMFRKMFTLKNSGKLVTNWGAVDYKDLLGRLPGERVRTSSGHQFLVKRPSLDEYVLHMRRGPTISYPKDAAAMLLMMDVNPGDVILEAGSGSGALSLFLSRAVGPEGCIHSVEVRSDHHRISRKNFLTWKSAWEIRSGRHWPDNVNFINKDVRDAMSDLQSAALDAVALDMLNPQVALPAIVGNLKQGAVCAVYVPNITQVIDVFEGIRSCQLPLLCEKVMEVSVTNWLVAPSLRRDGTISERVTPQGNLTSEGQTQDQSDDECEDDGRTDEDDSVIGSPPFGQLPYIARPRPWQIGHTAFLVQLRKCKAAAEATELGDPR